MAWSKNPLIYPKIFHDLLQAVEEGRDRIIFRVPLGRAEKYKFQFYAFKAAWEAKAERSRRLQNFQLAAAEDAKAAKLGRYTPLVDSDKVTFISKDLVVLEEGISIEVSESITNVDAHETIDLVAQDQATREESLAIRRERGKSRGGSPAVPAAPQMPIASPEPLAMKLFGVDTSRPRELSVAPVPDTPEAREELERIRKELEESGLKHEP